MRDILSDKEKRQLALLDALLEEPTATLLQISKVSGYPVRTLSDDISKLNALISPSKIISNTAGLSLFIPANSSPREIYSRFLNESREYQLLQYLFVNETDSLADISDNLYVSESTLKRMIHTLNTKFAVFGVSIKSAPYRLSGDETMISLFCTAILNQTNLTDNYLISEKQQHSLVNLCSAAAKTYQINLTYPMVTTLCHWIFVRLTRIKHGHHMPPPQENIAMLPPVNPSSCKFLENIQTDEIRELFGIQITPDIVYEIFYLYANSGYAHNEKDLLKIISKSPRHKNLYESIKLTLKKISEGLDIPLYGTQKLLLNLFNYQQPPNTPVYAIYDKNAVFLNGFKKENEKIYTIVSRAVSEVYGDTLPEYEKSAVIYKLITHWPGIMEKAANNSPPITVGIFFDADKENAALVANLLRRYSKLDISVIIPDPVLDLEYSSIYKGLDLLITNIPGLEAEDLQIVCIQEYPSKRDWKNITLAIERVYNQKAWE